MKRKAGMALTIELIVVLSIVMMLLSFGIGVANRAMTDSKITNIITEYSSVSSAVSQFKDVYGYYPGDVIAKRLSGKMYDSEIIDKYNIIMNNSDAFHQSGTNSVGVAKSMLSFAQLSKAGLINFRYNLSDINSNNICIPINSLKNKVFMTTKYSKYAIWLFSIDSNNSTSQQVLKNSNIYNATEYKRYSNRPRLTILNPTNLSGCEVNMESGVGVVSSIIAKGVEDRLLDGNASASNGMVVSDAKTGSTECYNKTNGSYYNSSSTSPNEACAMTMFFD